MSLQCEYAMSKFVMSNFEKSFRPDFGIHNQIQSFHSWDPLMYYDRLWAIQNTNRRHGLAVNVDVFFLYFSAAFSLQQ